MSLAEELGLPGLFDVHVHFMPDAVQRKVWAFFDQVDWPIEYRGDEAERLATLRALGVRRFPSLLYPHRPGMAAWLNGWAAEFAARTPDCLPTGTFYPEPDAARYVERALDGGVRIWKAHVQVGGYDPADPALDGVWGRLAEAGTPVVIHCGSGPAPGAHTGPGPVAAVLARHPSLCLVIAHAGLPEYAEHLDLVEKYDRVYLDTTMVGTDFTERVAPLPPAVRDRWRDHGDRILLGSDFPSIPYPYQHQLDVLAGFGFGDDWLRAVLWHNAAALFA